MKRIIPAAFLAATLLVGALPCMATPADPSNGATPAPTAQSNPIPTPAPTPRKRKPHPTPIVSPTPSTPQIPSNGTLPNPQGPQTPSTQFKATGPLTAPQPYSPQMQALPVPPQYTVPAPDFVPADVPDRPMTADEAARIALVHQGSVTVAVATVQNAHANSEVASAGYLPSVSLTGNGAAVLFANQAAGGSAVSQSTTTAVATAAGTASTTTSTTTVQGYTMSATLKELFFDFQHTRDLIRQAKAQERSAFANLSIVQQTLVLTVKQDYYTYVQDLRLVRVNEVNLQNSQEQLALAVANYRAGIGLPSDVVMAQTAVADAIFNLNQAQTTAQIAKFTLAAQLGIDPRTPFSVVMNGSEPSNVDTSNPAALYETALRQRPEILQAIANLQAAQFGAHAAKNSDDPSISGTASYIVRGEQITNLDQSVISAGVQITWPVLDFTYHGRVNEARAAELTAQGNLAVARINVQNDVATSLMNLVTAQQRLVTSAAEVQNAEESVRLADGRYRAGLGTFLDVLTAETSLVTAETNQVNAQSTVDSSRAALAHAIGMALPDVAGAGTAVPPVKGLNIPTPMTEDRRGAWPIPIHPGAPSNAPGAPAARGKEVVTPLVVPASAQPPSPPQPPAPPAGTTPYPGPTPPQTQSGPTPGPAPAAPAGQGDAPGPAPTPTGNR